MPRPLPPRLARTLERLLSGESEKEIARHLRLSRHTVHEYVGDIYRRFGVRSRAELMAKCLRAVSSKDIYLAGRERR